jgi:hypothetical protein
VGFFQMLEERTDLLRLVVAESGSNPVVAAALGRVTQEAEQLLVAYPRARINVGELRDHDPAVPSRALFWAFDDEWPLGPGRSALIEICA